MFGEGSGSEGRGGEGGMRSWGSGEWGVGSGEWGVEKGWGGGVEVERGLEEWMVAVREGYIGGGGGGRGGEERKGWGRVAGIVNREIK